MTNFRDRLRAWVGLPEPSPMPGQVVRKVLRFTPEPYVRGAGRTLPVLASLDTGNIITSEVRGKPGTHKPVIDLDWPAKLLPSSTPGHFHLYIDKEMPWDDYVKLLEALVAVGLVEPGYLGASKERGYTAARLPWIRKETNETR